MLEFITRPTKEYRDERIRRGQLVKDICGPNAFPFFLDLKSGARFPNNGAWIAGSNGKLVTAKWYRRRMEMLYLDALAEQRGLNRGQRRQLGTPSAMRKLFRESTSTWGTKREDFEGFPVSNELIESGVLTRFMKGQCSDAEFEQRVNRWLCDPAELSRIYYDYADKPNLLDDFFGPSLDKLEEAFCAMQQAFGVFDDLKQKMRAHRKDLIGMGFDQRTFTRVTSPTKPPTLDPSNLVQQMERLIGDGRVGHIALYVMKAFRKGYNFKRSDFMDIMQMCYVPDCDLFRCDKAMADLFRDYEPFSGKLVAKFADLPAQVELRLSSRKT